MEPRKILITNESLTSCDEIMSTAVTVADLKAEMTEKGISYADKVLVEGRSRTKLEDDSQQLPLTVMYKGQTTNELSIMLMTPAKKVSSGASERSEIYAAIKEHNLQQAVMNVFGKNFTQVSTAELKQFYADTMSAVVRAEVKEVNEAEIPMTPEEAIEEPVVKEEVSTEECKCNCAQGVDNRCREAFLKLIDILGDYGTIEGYDKEELYAILGGEAEREAERVEEKAQEKNPVIEQLKDEFSWMRR